MAEIVDTEQWAQMQASGWPRLREALQDHASRSSLEGREQYRQFLADVLGLFCGPGVRDNLEMELAIAARDAGVKIRTGRLRIEQEWASVMKPVATGHPRQAPSVA